MKEQVVDSTAKRIKHVQFGAFGVEDIARVAEIEVFQKDLYRYTETERKPASHGVLDKRLGVSQKDGICETCGLGFTGCAGHFGYVRLTLPVFHVGYFGAVLNVLKCICKTCSRILLSLDEVPKFRAKLRNPKLDYVQRARIVKNVIHAASKQTRCGYCFAVNGFVKRGGSMRIVHDKYRTKAQQLEADVFKGTFQNAMEVMPEIKNHLNKAIDDLNSLRVLQLLRNVPDEDVELLGMDPKHSRPENMLWTYFPVPPACIRPSVPQDGGQTNEDDLTVKIAEIILTNALIRKAVAEGQPTQMIMEQWEFLQLCAALYINSELPSVPKDMLGSKINRGVIQRLKGKEGRFRGNLSGKRVDFSGRTVISPDPNMSIEEVAVPILIAQNLTYPERVTSHNIRKLKGLVRNGPGIYPGANYVVSSLDESKKYLRFADKEFVASHLRTGDIVERHLEDGDAVLFNRQPSLHKLSIMCHLVRVKPWRTLRFNECVCNPYNADFDGDEMNLHVPQTEEARAEAIELMGVKNNLITPKNGQPIVAAIQDFITASYLLSRKDLFFNRTSFCLICCYFGDAKLHVDLPPPAIVKPVRLWTGKQLLSLLLRPNKSSKVKVNLSTKTRSFQKVTDRPPDLCPNDGWLEIYNSEVMCGVFDKAVVGDGNKKSVFYTILKDFGPGECATVMNRVSKLCARWLANHGFSIGLNDVTAQETLWKRKEGVVESGYKSCDELIHQSARGELENMAGCDLEQTLENRLSGVLSKIRDDVGQLCMQDLSRFNAPVTMSTCGSKGSKINVSQMVACVGQQIISGNRVPDGFENRSLPHFPRRSKEPPAKGFVRNSFRSGLTPTEFFFHAISGREGLVDTAVKTAETGYMQRRLMKALEDLTTHYDKTVRNTSGTVMQFVFGDDGLDPVHMEGDGAPVDFQRNLLHAQASDHGENDRTLRPSEIRGIYQQVLAQPQWLSNTSKAFRDEVSDFIEVNILQKIIEKATMRDQVSWALYQKALHPGVKIEGGLGSGRAPTRHGLPTAEMVLEVMKTGGAPKCLTSPRDLSDRSAVEYLTHAFISQIYKVTETQLRSFLGSLLRKYNKAHIEPGTAVGAIGAQSIGEPGTQMTLKTFHFAGVASMNITLGVPRIKEIINAAKTINTPIIKACLKPRPGHNITPQFARAVKGRVEQTFLGDIAEYVKEVYAPKATCVEIKINQRTVNKLMLEVDMASIVESVSSFRPLKLKDEAIQIKGGDVLRILADPTSSESMYLQVQSISRQISRVPVIGFSEVKRAVINDDGLGRLDLMVEGRGFREVMTTEGVDGTRTTSNHIMETFSVLGIEAARQTIIREVQYTMGSHGMTIDNRHVMLLADLMTFKGEVLGVTRHGIAKMRDSVLMLASFEKTPDHLFDAATLGKRDPVEGVSECIIMGIPIKLGTGLFKLWFETQDDSISPRRKPLFDRADFHVPLHS